MMSIVILKSEYIYTANTVYNNLLSAQDTFALEVSVISYAKCALLNEKEFKSFNVDGYHVSIYETNDGYNLYVQDYCINIVVYERQIISYSICRDC